MRHVLLVFLTLTAPSLLHPADAQIVETTHGRVEGVVQDSVQVFKGIPYAKPPVGERRWRPPQPPDDWTGVRDASRFGPRCMQPRPYGDMIFRSEGMSEDCLYLNVWASADPAPGSRPVLVYLYGGGFLAGDGSEPRYDGASMAAEEGLVVVTLNYRLGVFGFLAHPQLTAESPHDASGNYGLLDQARALAWVQENIAAFGGDPDRVTLGGESAGSISVSAHMASPRSTGRFDRGIGESGALLGSRSPPPLDEAEATGRRFAEQIGADSLSALRTLSASRLLELATQPRAPRFGIVLDGHFFPAPPSEVYAAGEQASVPLLLGWNSKEMGYEALLGSRPPTPDAYAAAVRERYGAQANRVLDRYAATTWREVMEVGTALASDRFIGYGTWKWGEMHRHTGAPVYRYFYTHPRPPMKEGRGNDVPGLAGTNEHAHRVSPPLGAVHSAEIEYALGNLSTNNLYAWTPADRRVSEHLQSYIANFVRTGDPNGPDHPAWPAAGTGERTRLLRINATPEATEAPHRARYELLDQLSDQ